MAFPKVLCQSRHRRTVPSTVQDRRKGRLSQTKCRNSEILYISCLHMVRHLCDRAILRQTDRRQNQRVVFKHFLIQSAESIFQLQLVHCAGIGYIRKDLPEYIQAPFYPGISTYNPSFLIRFLKTESRMPTDRKIHIVVSGIVHFPFHDQAVFFENICNDQFKIKGIYFFCFFP